MPENQDRGTAPLRLEWVEETTAGEVPDNPSWNGFSYNITNPWQWEPDANNTSLRGSGEPKPRGHFNGSETHDAGFEYSLARWFKDSGGNVQDPALHFLDLSSTNWFQATHSVVSRREYNSGGSDSAGRRHYVVGKGGGPSSVTLPFETEEGTPIAVGLEYQFQKIRTYDISQPSASTTLTVQSTSTNDTTQDVTIEDEGAATTETVTLNGTTAVTTTATYTDIDAVELSAETEGDVTVTDGSGTTFVTISGQNAYNHGEGDLGVPALGSGSHASAISEGNEVIFIDDTLDYDGTAIADEIESGELTIDFGIDSNSKSGGPRQNIHPTEWSAELTATVAGEGVTEQQMNDYLQGAEYDIKWTANQGNITLSNAWLNSSGEYAPETGNAKVMLDGTYNAEDITVSNEGA